MQKGLSSYPDKEMSLGRKRETTTSSEGSFSTQKESLQHPSEVSPPNISGMKRYSARKNRRDYLDTPFGIMPSNYSQEHLPHYPDDSSPLPRAKLPRHKNL